MLHARAILGCKCCSRRARYVSKRGDWSEVERKRENESQAYHVWSPRLLAPLPRTEFPSLLTDTTLPTFRRRVLAVVAFLAGVACVGACGGQIERYVVEQHD